MNISTTHGTGSHPGHDHETTAAISRSIGAWGAVQLGTMVLITPEEIDQAEKKTLDYRPPDSSGYEIRHIK